MQFSNSAYVTACDGLDDAHISVVCEQTPHTLPIAIVGTRLSCTVTWVALQVHMRLPRSASSGQQCSICSRSLQLDVPLTACNTVPRADILDCQASTIREGPRIAKPG